MENFKIYKQPVNKYVSYNFQTCFFCFSFLSSLFCHFFFPFFLFILFWLLTFNQFYQWSHCLGISVFAYLPTVCFLWLFFFAFSVFCLFNCFELLLWCFVILDRNHMYVYRYHIYVYKIVAFHIVFCLYQHPSIKTIYRWLSARKT